MPSLSLSASSTNLHGLVVIGGVTSNTDAAQLAETFAEAKCSTKVVGVLVTLNGDLRNQFVETNVGFDMICKVNSQLISNVCTDALSAEKYYYFIRLMGRKASHVALECTLQSHPNMVISLLHTKTALQSVMVLEKAAALSLDLLHIRMADSTTNHLDKNIFWTSVPESVSIRREYPRRVCCSPSSCYSFVLQASHLLLLCPEKLPPLSPTPCCQLLPLPVPFPAAEPRSSTLSASSYSGSVNQVGSNQNQRQGGQSAFN